jgi:hypothetical protein
MLNQEWTIWQVHGWGDTRIDLRFSGEIRIVKASLVFSTLINL